MEKKILNEFVKTDPNLWKKNILDDLQKLGYKEIPKYNSKENIIIEPFYTDNIKVQTLNILKAGVQHKK